MKVVRQLHRQGYQALLAGGCVRDMLLGKIPHDYDIATNATPQAVQELFRRTINVGAKFGVVIVLIQTRKIEVATFRSDAQYHDGRHPQKVVFTDARHDAERRDFTINGMFLDPITDEVIDYVGGLADLEKQVIRAIGDPDQRFAEDHLRMLRAIRFASRLGFKIIPKTKKAIETHARKLNRISAERIAGELERILADPNRHNGVILAKKTGLLPVIFKNIDMHHLEVGTCVLQHLPKRASFTLSLAALMSKCPPKDVTRFCRELKTSNELRNHVVWLIENTPILLDAIPIPSRGQLKRWLSQPLFELLITLITATLKADSLSGAPLRKLRRQIHQLGDEPIAPPKLLNGHELITLGSPTGYILGELTEELYLAQLENHVKTKTQARDWAKRWLEKHKKT